MENRSFVCTAGTPTALTETFKGLSDNRKKQ